VQPDAAAGIAVVVDQAEDDAGRRPREQLRQVGADGAADLGRPRAQHRVQALRDVVKGVAVVGVGVDQVPAQLVDQGDLEGVVDERRVGGVELLGVLEVEQPRVFGNGEGAFEGDEEGVALAEDGVAAERQPVIVRRGGTDLAAVVPLEYLELLQDILARQEAEQLAKQIDRDRVVKASPPPQHWFDGEEPKPF
jgi:hypothetical protein